MGRWVHTQRHQRRLQEKGKKSCMTPERIELLDQLGFSWEVKPSLERPRATWQQRLEELSDHYSKYRHFHIDPHTQPHLYGWCQEQKQRLKLLEKNDGQDITKRMGPDRVASLKAIGFTKDVELTRDDPSSPAASPSSSPATMAMTMTMTTNPIGSNNATSANEISYQTIDEKFHETTVTPRMPELQGVAVGDTNEHHNALQESDEHHNDDRKIIQETPQASTDDQSFILGETTHNDQEAPVVECFDSAEGAKEEEGPPDSVQDSVVRI